MAPAESATRAGGSMPEASRDRLLRAFGKSKTKGTSCANHLLLSDYSAIFSFSWA